MSSEIKSLKYEFVTQKGESCDILELIISLEIKGRSMWTGTAISQVWSELSKKIRQR